MIAVDMIGRIRRAYFDRQRSIKEIVRTLSVSRATVRKVVRGQATEFKYERGVQGSPFGAKLGSRLEAIWQVRTAHATVARRPERDGPLSVSGPPRRT